MDTLSIDVLTIIFTMVDPGISQIAKLKTVCKKFLYVLSSPRLSFLYHGKYMKWWSNKLSKTPPSKTPPSKISPSQIFKCETYRSKDGNDRMYITYTRRHSHCPWIVTKIDRESDCNFSRFS